LAKLPADAIAELTSKGKQPTSYDIDQYERKRKQASELRKITKRIGAAGHFCLPAADLEHIDNLDMPPDTATELWAALQKRKALTTDDVHLDRVYVNVDRLDEYLAGVAPGSIFSTTTHSYGVTNVHHWTVTSDDELDEDDDEDQTPAERAFTAAVKQHVAEENAWRASVEQAKRSFVRDEKPAKITAILLNAIIEQSSRSYDKTARELLGVGKDVDLEEYARQSAANLARTAAAVRMSSYGFSLPDLPERPAYPRRSDYDHLDAESDEEAEAMAQVQAEHAEFLAENGVED
jgi:hypothetical protein